MSEEVGSVETGEVEGAKGADEGKTSPTKEAARRAITVNNMEDLRTKDPKMYKATLEGIAHTIIRQMRRHQEQLKKLMREGQRQK